MKHATGYYLCGSKADALKHFFLTYLGGLQGKLDMIKEADALTQAKLEIEMDIISSEIALIIEYVEGMNPAPANELMVQLDAKITLIRQKAARQEFDDELMQLWKEVGDIRDASVKINT